MSADRQRFELAVCAIVKNVADYLLEWLEFHKLVGVERFYLYDNGSDDDTRLVLEPYVSDGLVILNNFPGATQQLPAYAHCLAHYGSETSWLAFIDIDEFLFSPEYDDLRELMRGYPDVPALAVNWVNFGPSGHEEKPRGLQIKNYTRRAVMEFGGNLHVKSIVRPAATLQPLSPHHFAYANDRVAVNERGEPVPGARSAVHTAERIRINHYATRSVAECRQKWELGRADAEEQRLWSYFEERLEMFDVAPDHLIRRFVPSLRPALWAARQRRRARQEGVDDSFRESG